MTGVNKFTIYQILLNTLLGNYIFDIFIIKIFIHEKNSATLHFRDLFIVFGLLFFFKESSPKNSKDYLFE